MLDTLTGVCPKHGNFSVVTLVDPSNSAGVYVWHRFNRSDFGNTEELNNKTKKAKA